MKSVSWIGELRSRIVFIGLSLILVLFAAKTFAADITFTQTGTGSGTLGSTSFTERNFTITGVGVTTLRQSCGVGCFFINLGSPSITISGVGAATFITPTQYFVNNSNSAVGFSRAGSSGADLFNGPVDSAFSTWDMLTSIGPISGPGLLLQWTLSPVTTSLGTLVFNDGATIATFTASVMGFKFSFPLPNKTAYTVKIATVFDHSMFTRYCANNVVTAYTGEQGQRKFGFQKTTSFVCPDTDKSNDLYSFKNSIGSKFSVNGQYTAGSSDPKDLSYLSYDGHPGYDYSTKDQSPFTGIIDVLAAADGTVVGASSNYGTITIDHGGGYKTLYIHLFQCFFDGQYRPISQCSGMVNKTVKRGQVIGKSGGTGKNGVLDAYPRHLHFEVRKDNWPVDPYGWTGSYSDPYTGLTGIVNVKLW